MSADQNNTQKTEFHWHTHSSKDILEKLHVSENGLTSAEAKSRLEKYGRNQLKEQPRPSFLSLLFNQLKDFVVMLLIVSAGISIALGETIDAIAIISIVVLNAVLGIVQERRAEEALAALKKLAAPEAQVMRDGMRVSVPGEQLVIGDIVYLEAGNFVPADLRLIDTVNLNIEEASLTGESLAVKKNAALMLKDDAPLGDRKNSAFMGTTVSYGRGMGVITSTGMDTQLGQIAEMLQKVETEETPLQKRLNALGKSLSIVALILVALVFIIEILHQTDLGLLITNFSAYFGEYAHQVTEAFMIAVSLAIAAVPEGLPAVVTISLALGMQEMVRKHALVRKLSSVETLGSATTICSDKTGTLTQNSMTVTRMWAGGETIEVTGTGYTPEGDFLVDGKSIDLREHPAALTAIWLGALNNDADVTNDNGETGAGIIGDPTEAALIVLAEKAGGVHRQIDESYPREKEVPFDSDRKRMITVHNITAPESNDLSPFHDTELLDWDVIAIKGAPDVILDLCEYVQQRDDTHTKLTPEKRAEILAANEAMTKDALRVLGVAYRVVPETPSEPKADALEKDLVFVGLLGMIDPPREEVKPALATARQAGIRTVMITGDFPNTARAIAESIGLLQDGRNVMTGPELDKISEEELVEVVKNTDVFARVSPEHKMRIVDALQANDEVVAMTGDGVNDAPAIKRADIGIAMGITGTDVAKQTADMVLTDDNYASIVSAVAQGRVIYGNIRKFVFFLLSSNVAEIMIIFLAALAGLPAPLTAIQLLWLNLVTDGAPALALAMEKGDPDVMEQQPRPKNESIVNRSMFTGIMVQMVAQTSVVLFAFAIGLLWELEKLGFTPALAGQNAFNFLLSFDWRSVNLEALRTAETMAFLTLSMAELFRAYTVRSERASLFTIGVFSNKWMQYAVGVSMTLLIVVSVVPFLQDIFNTHVMSGEEWMVVLACAIFPAIAEEITKIFLRMRKA